ncbi:hypothetical protein Trydic_g4276 [Trypoxylus dichotomus]
MPLYIHFQAKPVPQERLMLYDACITGWIQRGADPKKLILGIGIYGRTFTLNSSNNGLGAPACGGGSTGPCTRKMGYLEYNEICQKILGGGWTVVWNEEQQIPYAYNGNQWIGYENEIDYNKGNTEYAKAKGLGGVMIWSLESDDFNGLCGRKNPLLTTITTTLSLNTCSDSGGSGGCGGCEGSGSNDSNCSATITTITTSTTTTEPPDGDCCQSDGFCSDRTNCDVFYQYLGGVAYKFTCAASLCFDPSLSTCNNCSLISG